LLDPASRSGSLLPPALRTARLLALIVPAALLVGAYVGELVFGLYPCEMCWWQRWPHFAGLILAAAAFVLPQPRWWVRLAALAILVSGAIGGFHAGVEYHWWQGITGCAQTAPASGGSALNAVINAPLVRCDQAPWSLFGISLAGWNFLISTAAGLTALWLSRERKA
jgi:disulfide bond formation protein DsbB